MEEQNWESYDQMKKREVANFIRNKDYDHSKAEEWAEEMIEEFRKKLKPFEKQILYNTLFKEQTEIKIDQEGNITVK